MIERKETNRERERVIEIYRDEKGKSSKTDRDRQEIKRRERERDRICV